MDCVVEINAEIIIPCFIYVKRWWTTHRFRSMGKFSDGIWSGSNNFTVVDSSTDFLSCLIFLVLALKEKWLFSDSYLPVMIRFEALQKWGNFKFQPLLVKEKIWKPVIFRILLWRVAILLISFWLFLVVTTSWRFLRKYICRD